MDLVAQFEAAGFQVRKFSEYHYRVNGEFDFFPNNRGSAFAWHDRYTGERGWKPADQMVRFAKGRLTDRPTECTKESFADTLLKIGWSQEEIDKAWEERNATQSSHQ